MSRCSVIAAPLHRYGNPHLARQFGLKPCFTIAESPQSNGLSEAVVNTLTRDRMNITPLSDAATLFGLIAGWFGDDNHPHSGRKMRSSREFIADQTATARESGETGAKSKRELAA